MHNALKHILLVLFITVLACTAAAQEIPLSGYTIDERGDTTYHLPMPAVIIYPRPAFRNERALREYQRLVFNFEKVYPYALLTRDRLRQIDAAMVLIKPEKVRKEFLRQQEKALFKEFEAPLRKLTFSQGRLLMRLIDREVGQTSFYVIRDLKGGTTAFFWQGIARLFGANLKKPYDKYGEDKPVEALVIMWHNGTFESYYWQVMGWK